MPDIIIKAPAANSASYVAFYPGTPFKTSDTVVGDYSGRSPAVDAIFQANATGASIGSTSGWLRMNSGAPGIANGFSLSKAQASNFALSSHSLLLAFQVQSPAMPSAGGQLLGSGAGAEGFGVSVSTTTGKWTGSFKGPSGTLIGMNGYGVNLCDNAPHIVIIYLDAVAKRGYAWTDGTKQVSSGLDLAGAEWTTNTFSPAFGNQGNPSAGGTWDNAVSPVSAYVLLRGIHMIAMATPLEAPDSIAAWLSYPGNILRPVPATLIP